LGISVRPHEKVVAEASAAHLGVVADLAVVDAGSRTDNADLA
jgi:hypothetical protein